MRPHPFRSNPVAVALIVLMSLVIAGLGVLSIVTRYAAERSGRLGSSGPLFDASAQQFGVAMLILGLLPLCLLARTGRRMAWSAAALFTALALNFVVGAALWE